MAETVITHLLHERDDTHGDGHWWAATHFPFSAIISNFKDGEFHWAISFMGAQHPFREGREQTWPEAVEALTAARRAALAQLKEQLA